MQRVHLPVNAHFAPTPTRHKCLLLMYSFTIRIGGIDVHIVLLRTCVLYMHKFTEFGVTIYTGSVWYDTIQFGMVLYATVWNGMVRYGLEWYGMVLQM